VKRGDQGYQDVQVLGLAVGAGEIGEEVLGERCRHKPETSAPSRNVLELSRNKRTAPQETVRGRFCRGPRQHLPLSPAKSGAFIMVAAIGRRGVGDKQRRKGAGGRERLEGLRERSWREEGNKREGFGGKGRSGVGGSGKSKWARMAFEWAVMGAKLRQFGPEWAVIRCAQMGC
jgi:hypothetical protein